jgi:hypothetical protein
MAAQWESDVWSASDAADSVARCAQLAAQSVGDLLQLVGQCAPTTSGSGPGTAAVTSEAFAASSASTTARTLTMSDSLVSVVSGNVIPDSAVSFSPPTLAAGQTTFQLLVARQGLSGSAFFGTVAVIPPAGSTEPVDHVPVWVQMP